MCCSFNIPESIFLCCIPLDAQYYLGIVYYYGEGVTADRSEAVKYFRKAAEQGHVHAMVNLGMVLWRSDEMEGGDRSSAASWFSRAASHGDPNAQWMLGKMHYDGLLAPKPDMREAFRVRGARMVLRVVIALLLAFKLCAALSVPPWACSSLRCQRIKGIQMGSSIWVGRACLCLALLWDNDNRFLNPVTLVTVCALQGY
jgi:hypothetical protein